MARVKRGVHAKKKHKAILKKAKGYFGDRSRTFRDRRAKKGEFRSLWIQRINAGCRQHDMSYSRFIDGLNKAGVEVDRKVLADLAVSDAATFKKLVDTAKAALV